MIPVHRFSRNALPATAWKNGGGSTCEIVSWPPGTDIDRFDWRVSIATIAASGPFSRFDGVDRTIMLLEGDGVRLHSADGRISHLLVEPDAPFAFDGGESIDCTLIGSRSTDFNVMSRRARGTADVRVVGSADTWAGAGSGYGLLMVLAGRWHAGDIALAEGDGLWWAPLPPHTPPAWSLVPASSDARLVAVSWRPIDKAGTT